MLKNKLHRKILVVDDDTDIRNLLSDSLPIYGYDVVVVMDGLEALNILGDETFSLVITDIVMPNMDGIQLLNKISKKYPDTDVIVMTGYSGEYSFVDMIKAGAIDYLIKPFKVDELMAKLDRSFRERDHIQSLKVEAERRKQLEKTSSNQEQFIHSALDALTHPFYVINVKDYTVKLANKASGFDPAKLGTQTCHAVTHRQDEPCNSAEHPCPMQEILKTKKPYSVEHVHYDAAGNEIIVDVHGYPIFDYFGEVSQIIEYSLDITLRKRAEEKLQLSENKYRGFVEGTSDLITQVDSQGRFTFVNHMAKEIFGYEPEECIGMLAFDFVYPEDQQSTKEWFNQVIESKSQHVTTENRQVNKKTGVVVHLSWTGSLQYDENENLLSFNGIARDITSRVNLELELKRAKENAEKTVRLKTEFLANMSHEIRTPMNVILGMNRLALSTDLKKDQHDYLTAVQQNAELLLGLIDSILDFSKIDADQLVLEDRPFDLPKLLQATIQQRQETAKDKGIDLEYKVAPAVPIMLSGDKNRLQQVLNNLMSNALNFSSSGRVEINVELVSQNTKGLLLQFSVTDTGIGISEEMHEKIFESFSQVDSTVSRIVDGAGFGLTISRKLVQLMGGDIWLKSAPGKGSTFYFTTIVRAANQGKVECSAMLGGEAGVTPEKKSLHVLLVDDNKFNRDIAEIVLKQQGYTVITAITGLDALEKLVSHRFDIILMDVQMPEMDGITASKIIRHCEQGTTASDGEYGDIVHKLREKLFGKRIPIVTMTANAIAGDREECLAAGIDAYLTKPFNPEELHSVLLQVVQSIKLRAGPEESRFSKE